MLGAACLKHLEPILFICMLQEIIVSHWFTSAAGMNAFTALKLLLYPQVKDLYQYYEYMHVFVPSELWISFTLRTVRLWNHGYIRVFVLLVSCLTIHSYYHNIACPVSFQRIGLLVLINFDIPFVIHIFGYFCLYLWNLLQCSTYLLKIVLKYRHIFYRKYQKNSLLFIICTHMVFLAKIIKGLK